MTDIPDRYWSDEEAERETPNPDLDCTVSFGEAKPAKSKKSLSEELGFRPGDEIGRYLLLSALGAGGMGVVFTAFDPDLNRKIALKFIRAESSPSTTMTNATVAAQSRLIQEAQAMARLAHPNVVAVYDVGTVGVHVYLAMELVDGQTLKAWIRQGGYGLAKMISIMVKAGRGLASAHDAGLVHRDFKPDNVLLGDDGRVCVGDFGLVYQERDSQSLNVSGARSPVQSGVGGDSITVALTEMGTVLGTPSYMSPEQHRGELVTPLSDQFSFCVCLFEAAYGVRPFLGRNIGEISAAIESSHITEPSVRRRVPRWLRAIILRGLSVDPYERFSSMHELLDELSMDRRSRFHKQLAGGLTVMMMASGIAYHEIDRAQDRRRCQSRNSEFERIWSSEKRGVVKEKFLQSGLSYANTAWSTVDKIMKRELGDWSRISMEACEQTYVEQQQSEGDFDLQMACLQSQKQQLWMFAALMAEADASVVEKSVSAAKGMTLSEECEDFEHLQQRVAPPQNPQHRVVARQLKSDLGKATMMRVLGKHQDSRRLARRVADRAHEINYAPILAEAYYLMAWQHADAYENRLAQANNLRAMTYGETSGDDSFAVTIASQGIFIHGHLLANSNATDEWVSHARAHLQRAGTPPIRRAKFLSNSGAAYGTNGRLEESEAVFRESLDIYERELGRGHRETMMVRNNLAVTLTFMNKYSEAELHFRKSIVDAEATLGPDHPFLILPISNLSTTLSSLGKFKEAITVANRSVDISELASGVDAPQSTREYLRRSDLFIRAGKYQRALRAWQRNVRSIDERRPANYTVKAYLGLTEALLRLGRLAEADEALRHVALDRRGPADGNLWHRAFVTAIELSVAQGRTERASQIFRRLTDFGIDPFLIREDREGRVALVVGHLRLAEENFSEAMRLHRLAYKRAQARFPSEENTNLVPYERALARTLAKMRKPGAAIKWMESAIRKLQNNLSDCSHLLVSANLQLAKIYGDSGQLERAHRLISEAVRAIRDPKVEMEMDPREIRNIRNFERELRIKQSSVSLSSLDSRSQNKSNIP